MIRQIIEQTCVFSEITRENVSFTIYVVFTKVIQMCNFVRNTFLHEIEKND